MARVFRRPALLEDLRRLGVECAPISGGVYVKGRGVMSTREAEALATDLYHQQQDRSGKGGGRT